MFEDSIEEVQWHELTTQLDHIKIMENLWKYYVK